MDIPGICCIISLLYEGILVCCGCFVFNFIMYETTCVATCTSLRRLRPPAQPHHYQRTEAWCQLPHPLAPWPAKSPPGMGFGTCRTVPTTEPSGTMSSTIGQGYGLADSCATAPSAAPSAALWVTPSFRNVWRLRHKKKGGGGDDRGEWYWWRLEIRKRNNNKHKRQSSTIHVKTLRSNPQKTFTPHLCIS